MMLKYPKPKWEDAPSWATYKTMDKNGIWRWHEGRPYIRPGEMRWRSDGKTSVVQREHINWRTSNGKRSSS